MTILSIVAQQPAAPAAPPSPSPTPRVAGPLSRREVDELARELANAAREGQAAEAQEGEVQAIADAQLAAEQAASAGVPAPGRTIIRGADGVVRELPTGDVAPAAEGITIAPPPDTAAEIAREVNAGLGVLAGAALGALAIWLFFRTLQKWIEVKRSPAALPRESLERLARIENAIEAMAVEVERISEGQRFTTRLLSDRAPTPVERG